MLMSNTSAQENFSDNKKQVKIRTIKYVLITIFSILFIRLFSLQIWKHKTYLAIAQKHTLLNIKKTALRAQIEDRNGIILAKSQPIFKITFSGTKQELKHINKILIKHGHNSGKIQHFSLVFKKLLWPDLVSIFSINEIPMPDIEIDQARTYPLGPACAHIIGYVQNNLENEYIGTTGVEKAYNTRIIGEYGKDTFTINAKRQRIEKCNSSAAKEARTLKLTIDSKLSLSAYEELAKVIQGAIVIVDANGEVLSAVSYPSFNPEDFTIKNLQAIRQYYANPLAPLFNIFLGGRFATGSTIKPFMVTAMLKKGVPTQYFCTGRYTLGDHTFRCWSKHGNIDISQILPQSCNCAFYSWSQYLTQADLADTWKIFGLGESILDNLTKNHPKFPAKKKWKKVDSLFMQIGQGSTIITLAQLTRAYARLATGKKIELHLIKCNEEAPELNIPPAHLQLVRKALFDTVNSPLGTAYAVYKPMDAAGKTGTAQVKKLQEHEYGRSNRIREWKFRDHSLFCAFAPYNNPRVIGCAIIIHGGSGRNAASLLLKLLDKTLQNLKIQDEKTC